MIISVKCVGAYGAVVVHGHLHAIKHLRIHHSHIHISTYTHNSDLLIRNDAIWMKMPECKFCGKEIKSSRKYCSKSHANLDNREHRAELLNGQKRPLKQ